MAQIGLVCSWIGSKELKKPNHMISKGKETIAVNFKSGKKVPFAINEKWSNVGVLDDRLPFNVALKTQPEEKRCELRFGAVLHSARKGMN